MANYEIKIDQEKCISCGTCEAVCPDFFEMKGDDNKAHVKKVEVDDLGCAQEGADACPVQCIKIITK